MKDEEIKAIERCNELIKESHSCWIGITNQVAIQTVLNLIEKQKAEIEKYKNLYQIALDNTIKSDRELLTLKRDFEIVDHECNRLEQEDIRKDKIINEMAKTIYDYANLEVLIKCPAEYEGKYNMDLCKMNVIDRNCLICIKEYFENKVKESK